MARRHLQMKAWVNITSWWVNLEYGKHIVHSVTWAYVTLAQYHDDIHLIQFAVLAEFPAWGCNPWYDATTWRGSLSGSMNQG